MIIDTSAIVAMVRGESDANDFVAALEQVGRASISAATALECSLVLHPEHEAPLTRLLAGLSIVPFDEDQLAIAREAHDRFGKGSGSPARLNLGDCFSYALAKTRGEPLLFKGDDFTDTDVESAL